MPQATSWTRARVGARRSMKLVSRDGAGALEERDHAADEQLQQQDQAKLSVASARFKIDGLARRRRARRRRRRRAENTVLRGEGEHDRHAAGSGGQHSEVFWPSSDA